MEEVIMTKELYFDARRDSATAEVIEHGIEMAGKFDRKAAASFKSLSRSHF